MLQRKKEREGLEAEISKSVSKSQPPVPGMLRKYAHLSLY